MFYNDEAFDYDMNCLASLSRSLYFIISAAAAVYIYSCSHCTQLQVLVLILLASYLLNQYLCNQLVESIDKTLTPTHTIYMGNPTTPQPQAVAIVARSQSSRT